MSLLIHSSSVSPDALEASWLSQPVIFLAVAAVCLMIVLRYLKRAIAPIGALIQAIAAAAVVAFAALFGLAMLVLAAVATLR